MEALISDITKGSEEALFPSIRSALERGWSKTFMQALQEAKEKKEAEIDRLCSRNYGSFLNSVQQLLAMKGSAGDLRILVTTTHDNFNTIGKNLIELLTSLEALDSERESAKKLLDAIFHCKEVARMMVEAQDQLDAEDHYAALQTIEKLQTEQHNITVRPFLSDVQIWLPKATNRLMEAAKHEVNLWIAQSKDKNALLGATLLRKYAKLATTNTHVVASNKRAGSGGEMVNSGKNQTTRGEQQFLDSIMQDLGGVSISLLYILRNGRVFRLRSWLHPDDFEAVIPSFYSAQASEEGIRMLDTLPEQLDAIHKALYIFAALGELNALYEHCFNARSPILQSIFDSAHKDAEKNGIIAAFPSFLSNVCGFFVLECVCRQCIHHYHQGEGYFSWSNLYSIWDSACKDIERFCAKHANSMISPDDAMLAKEYILLLQETMSDPAFGFKTHYFVNIIQTIWNKFESLQLDMINKACSLAFDNCAYQPMTVETEDRLEDRIRAFRLDTIKLDAPLATNATSPQSPAHHSAISAGLKQGDGLSDNQNPRDTMSASDMLDAMEDNYDIGGGGQRGGDSRGDDGRDGDRRGSSTGQRGGGHTNPHDSEMARRYGNGNYGNHHQAFIPITFPFSEAVPIVVRELHVMITRFFMFAVRNKHSKSIGESVCKAISKAFAAMSQTMLKKLLEDGAETPLSKACQISIDAATLAQCCMTYLRAFLSGALAHFKWSDAIDLYLPKAINESRREVNDVAHHAQDMVFEVLALKVDDLLGSLEFIYWEPDEYPNCAHEQIDEVIDYLRATFMWLTHLPQTAREAAHFTCCTRVTSGIIEFVLSPRVSRLNILSIVALDYDVKRLQSFADSCGIKQLRQCFNELLELVLALLHPDLPAFGDDAGLRQQLFPQVDPGRLAAIIEKMSATPTAINLSHANLPKLDKKLIFQLSKKLKLQSRNY